MPSPLDNLVAIGKLKREPPAEAEINGLLRAGRAKLEDAENPDNSLESRFDLAYNAAHALALAALRLRGYRSESRYVVFQALVHTIGLANEQWRVLERAHNKRNAAEYEVSSTWRRKRWRRRSESRSRSQRVSTTSVARASVPAGALRPHAIILTVQ